MPTPSAPKNDNDTADKMSGGFTVLKSNGESRWLSVSSNAYQDREGEIVSQRALEQAVKFNDHRNYYGPLRWWHVGDVDRDVLKAGEGLDFGDCDFQMVHGKFLLESGTFRDERVASALKDFDGQISIRFFCPPGAPTEDGVFDDVVIFERSLLPRGKAANRFTAFIQKEGDSMEQKDKVQEFVSLMGDADFASGVLLQIGEQEKANNDAGVKSKSDESWIDKLKALVKPVEPEDVDAAADETEDNPESEDAPAELTADSIAAAVTAGIKDAFKSVEKSAVDADTEKANRDALENALQRISALEGNLTDAKKEITEILGKPGHRASQEDETVIDQSKAAADGAGMADFMTRIGGK